METKKPVERPHLRRFRNHFVTGLVLVMPLLITAFILNWLFNKIAPPEIVAKWQASLGFEDVPYFGFTMRVLGLMLVVLIISFIGMLARNIVGRRLIALGEYVVSRIPLAGKIYNSSKQVIQAFSANKALFQRVVLVEYPRKGIWSMAFVTSQGRGEIRDKLSESILNVFIPTTPNPTSGFLLLVEEKDTIPLSTEVVDGMKMIISFGVVVPETKKNELMAGETEAEQNSQSNE